MNQKVRHLGKRKTDSSTRKRPIKLHTSEYTNSYFKKKIALYSNEDTIDYNQQCHPLQLGNEQYKQFPQKRKNLKKEKGRGKEKKRECERRGTRRRKRRRKKRKRGRESENGREKEKEKEKKEDKEKEEKNKEEKIEKAVLKVLL